MMVNHHHHHDSRPVSDPVVDQFGACLWFIMSSNKYGHWCRFPGDSSFWLRSHSQTGMASCDEDAVTLVIKNADGVTPDTTFEGVCVDETTVADVKAHLQAVLSGAPDISWMKVVCSGR